MSNKIKFIQNLLLNEKFNPSQYERFIKLVSKELDKSSKVNIQILENLDEIKKKLGIRDSNHNGKGNSDQVKSISSFKHGKSLKKESLPKIYYDPQDLQTFLHNYNQNEILKYTCHEIDSKVVIEEINSKCGLEQYNFQKHLELIISTFKNFKTDYIISPKIINLILVYLEGKSFSKKTTTWSRENVMYNWSSPALLTWSNENISIIPNPGTNINRSQKNKGFSFNGFNSNTMNTRIRTFSELVIHFKNLLHLNGDNSLLEIIKNINEKNKWNDKVEFNINREDFDEEKCFKKNIVLFTDVDSLIKGYSDIIELAFANSETGVKPIIDLSFISENNKIEFSIHHLNSKITKKRATDFVDRIGEHHTGIINNLNGLCDLYLKAEFSYGECSEVNLWNNKKRGDKPISSFLGVKHMLKFK